jgi:hypothetical protein
MLHHTLVNSQLCHVPDSLHACLPNRKHHVLESFLPILPQALCKYMHRFSDYLITPFKQQRLYSAKRDGRMIKQGPV